MTFRDAIALLADNSYNDRFTRLSVVLLTLFVFTFWWTGFNITDETHLEQIKSRGVLKVISRQSPTTYYESYGGPEGFFNESRLANQILRLTFVGRRGKSESDK